MPLQYFLCNKAFIQSSRRHSYIHLYSVHSATVFIDKTTDNSWSLGNSLDNVCIECCGYLYKKRRHIILKGSVGKWTDIDGCVGSEDEVSGFLCAGTASGMGSDASSGNDAAQVHGPAQALAPAQARAPARAAKRTAERMTTTGVVGKVESLLIWASSTGEIWWVRSMAAAWMAAAAMREMVSRRREALAGDSFSPHHSSTAQLRTAFS
jgi:hypothetical protein